MAGFSEHRPADLTRRGSLAYYLAAWVCGTFFFVLAAIFSSDHHWRYGNWLGLGIFSGYFLGLARAWPSVLLFAYLLRAGARLMKWHSARRWMLGGAGLTLLFGLCASFLPGAWMERSEWLAFVTQLFELEGENDLVLGGRMPLLSSLFTVFAGITTAYLLFCIDRAFAQRYERSMRQEGT